jgi:hypothetical protein
MQLQLQLQLWPRAHASSWPLLSPYDLLIAWCDFICCQIKQQCSTIQSQQLELCFQQKATEEHVTMGGGARARAHHEEPSFRIFNELNNDAAV